MQATSCEHQLAVLLSLLHRHTNQSDITIAYRDNLNQTRCVHFDFEDDTAFSAVKASVSKSLAKPPLADPATPPVCCYFNPASTEPAPQLAPGGFALTTSAQPSQTQLWLHFDGTSFLRERMQEFLDQYVQLCAATAQDETRAVLNYTLITPAGAALLADPTQTIEQPRYALLAESFAAVAQATPGAIAIRHKGQEWTYAQLDHASHALATQLLTIGTTPSDVVAVTGLRGFAVVAAILAVFRSGATLLTIDPKLPNERQLSIVQLAAAKVLVRAGEGVNLSPSGLSILNTDSEGKLASNSPHSPAETSLALPTLNPEAPAYIFFTSGSTGTPKGVVGTHQGLAHFLDWQRKTFDIRTTDRAAQITALSFDMVLRDMFLALTSGATLCIPAEEDVLDPTAIFKWMVNENVSVLHLVPSLLRAWVNNAPEGVALPLLRRVFLAGEPLTDKLILDFRETFGTHTLITNFYGPTETTLIKCFNPISGTPEPGSQPAGRPQPQTQIIVLNRKGQQCGVNEIGEIAIRTPYRTLGYLNAPDLSAKVFVPNPFRNDPQDLIYLTGDSGYIRQDGLVVMRGRIDNQVKIRGIRVEPGEVEAAISHCPLVAEVAVVAHTAQTGDKYLGAYVVANQQGKAAKDLAAEIRSFLKPRLPDGLIPAVITALESLPRLPNGKIDRKSLTPIAPIAPTATIAPGSSQTSDASDANTPRNAQEAELLTLWKSVLGHPNVGLNESFVELGGDSLTAITALVRMQRMGVSDNIARGIFQGWSIRQIAAAANGESSAQQPVAMPLKVRTNLLVNVMRGLLVAILVTGHWVEGLLNRLPPVLRGIQHTLTPLFASATPGFAILFGLGLGYIYFPKYLQDPQQAKKSLKLGAALVFTGIVVRSAADLGLMQMEGGIPNSTEFFNTFFSALLYYFLALLTAPVWFKLISINGKYWRNIIYLAIGSYLTYRITSHYLLDKEQTGFLQLCRLMLVAKFNYFNMSVGAFAGLAFGLFLQNYSKTESSLVKMLPSLLLWGGLLTATGVALLYGTTGGVAELYNEGTLAEWKWIFYSGTLLLATGLLIKILNIYENLPSSLRAIFNWTSVLGQISLPVFVLHQLVLRFKALFVHAGIPDGIALVIPLVSFLGFCVWMMNRLYGLYFGSTTSDRRLAR